MSDVLIGVVVFLLLLFVKESNTKLFPLIFVTAFFVLLARIWTTQIRELIERFDALFLEVPFARLILISATLFLLGQILESILDQFDMESLAYIVFIAIRISIVYLWLDAFEGVLTDLVELVQLFGG